MRRLLVLFPLVLVGCKTGRQASVSNSGRVASTSELGTWVAGRGRALGGGSGVAWSPDGRTLAAAVDNETVLWPSYRLLPSLSGPIVWSPDGTRLLGRHGDGVREVAVDTGGFRTLELGKNVQGLGWTSDGWPFAWSVDGDLRVESGMRLARRADIRDAVGSPGGGVAYVESWHPDSSHEDLRDPLGCPVRWGTWSANGTLETVFLGTTSNLLSSGTRTTVSLATQFKLSPGGHRLALAGIVATAGRETVDGLLKAMGKPKGGSEFERLSRRAHWRTVTVVFDAKLHRHEVWSLAAPSMDGLEPVHSLAWSPDGRWLAIARDGGTVRVRVQ